MDDIRYFQCECGCSAFRIYIGSGGFDDSLILFFFPRYICIECNTMYRFTGEKVQIARWIGANAWSDWEDIT
jgi:hypothetical protein